MSIFDKYAEKINSAELAASQQEIKDNASSGDFPKVPVGNYEVYVENIEAKKAKSSGNPMVSIQFRILNGAYEKSCLFYNGVYVEDWQRHRVAKILSDLINEGDRTAEINLLLKGQLKEVDDFCMDVAEAIDRLDYLLKYGKDKKDYNTFEIIKAYNARK